MSNFEDKKKLTEKELILGELEEIVGIFKGLSIEKTFTTIKVGKHFLVLENGTKSTKAIAERLETIRKGSRISLLMFNGKLRVRKFEEAEG